ncbi:hypothetical protein C8R43DRAFT_1035322 [Mycena crocata]|nr:hypothetical protein C8R43DRAFT_1035322 [Mycena crocata]
MPIRTETASEQLLSRKRRRSSDSTIVKLEEDPESIPATPAATTNLAPIPATWQHPDELPYIKSGWQDIEIIRFLTANVLTIPAQTHSSGQWVHVLCADGSTVVLPRAYRLPLLWVAKYQWRSLELVLTAREAIRQREWDDAKYEILHIARLCAGLVNAARLTATGKGIDRAWRCGLFDRALLRYWHEWLLMRDEFVRHFWYEFGESDFEADVLKRTWAQWVLKDHKGFSLTREEVARGISRQQFTEGFFVDEAAGTFEWIEALPDPPESPLTSEDELEQALQIQEPPTNSTVGQKFPACDNTATVKTEATDFMLLPCAPPQQHPSPKEDVVITLPCQKTDVVVVHDIETVGTDILDAPRPHEIAAPAHSCVVVPPAVLDWGTKPSTTDTRGCPLSSLTDESQDVLPMDGNIDVRMPGVERTGDRVDSAADAEWQIASRDSVSAKPRDSSGAVAALDSSGAAALGGTRAPVANPTLPVNQEPTIPSAQDAISLSVLPSATTSGVGNAIIRAGSSSPDSHGVFPLTDLVSMEEYPITPEAATFPPFLGDSMMNLRTEMGQLRASSLPAVEPRISQTPFKSRAPGLTRSVAVGAVRSVPSTHTRPAPYTPTRPSKSVPSPRAGRSESPLSARTASPNLLHPLRHLIYGAAAGEEMDVDADVTVAEMELEEERERSPSKAHIKFVLTLGEAVPPRARKFSHAAELREER